MTTISSSVSAPYMTGRAAVAATERSPVAARALPAELLAAVLLTTSALLPLTFLPVIEDAFGLPKFILLVIASAVIAMCVGVNQAAANRPVLIATVVAAPLAVYLSLNTIAFAFSIDSSHSLFGERFQYQGFISNLIYAAAFCGGAITFRSRSMTRLLFWTIALAGSAVSVYALVQMLDLDPLAWSYGSGPPDRAFSSIGQANALAAYLVLVIPITVILLAEAKGRARWLLVAAIALDLVALALTFSRAGYVAVALVFVVALFPFARRLAPRQAIFACAAACVVFVLLAVSVASTNGTAGRVANRAASIADITDISTQKHVGMWLVAGRITLDHPFSGTGQETYPETFQRYRDGDLPGFGSSPARPESPHNNYLAIASSAGIPALASYLAVTGAVLLLMLRSGGLKTNRLVLTTITAALLGHLLTDAFMTAEFTSSWLFWLLMGVGLGLTGARQASDAPASVRR